MVFLTLGAISAVDVNDTNTTSSVATNSVVENTTNVTDNVSVSSDAVVSDTDGSTDNGENSTVSSTKKYYNASLTDSNSNTSNQNETIVTNNDYYGVSNTGTNVSSSVNSYPTTILSESNSTVKNTSLTGTDLNKVYGDGQKFNVTLVDSDGNPIANQTVYFTVYGKTYKRTTNDDGIASLDIRFTPRTAVINYSYMGNEYYAVSNGSGKVVVSKAQTFINASNAVLIYGNENYLKIVLYDSNGNLISNKKVSFIISSKTYYRTTGDDGSANLRIRLNPGNYSFIVGFDGDDCYSESSNNVTADVEKNITTISPITDNIVIYGSNFSVKLTDLFNNPVSNAKVIFSISNKNYTRITDENGIANLGINLNNGNYTINYSYTDTNNDYTASGSSNISVYKNVTYISGEDLYMIVNSGDKFTVTLLDLYGNPLAGKTVTFMLYNKNYTRTTDENGEASLDIRLSSGNYTINYEYIDDAPELSSNGTNYIYVVDNLTSISADDLTMYYGSGEYFNVTLKDQFGNPLANQKVQIKVLNKTYNRTTDANGIARLQINLAAGVYNLTYSFAGTSAYPASSGNATVTVKKLTTNKYGVYVFGVNMGSVDLSELSANNIKNIFLNYYAVETYGTSAVEAFIARASKYGISVHIWMQVFYSDGSWVNPSTCGSTYLNSKIAEAVEYAQLEGVAGVHLDYLRYPGDAYEYTNAAQYITNFTRDLVNAVKAVNSDILVSAALMPETTQNVYYYGQDSDALGEYLDIIMPMVYKGNYNAGDSWIKSVSSYFKNHSGNAEVWVTLQAYESDDDTTKLSAAELKTDAQYALDGGADGIVFFRYAYTNLFNTSKLTGSSSSDNTDDNTNTNSSSNTNTSSKYVTIDQVISAAKIIKAYYAANSSLPTTVKVGSYTCTMSQFLYYECLAIVYLDEGKSTSTKISLLNITVSEPENPTGDSLSGAQWLRADYVDSANRTYKFILNYGQGPNYSNTPLGKIEYKYLIEAFSRILAFYDDYGQLSNYNTMNTGSSSSSDSGNAANTSSITALAKSLTSGLSSDYDKAVALFNWVRDNIEYSYYYNSQQGAALTLSLRSGNCCDQSNLYVALCRSVGLTIRYVHGYCHFSDGWYGHVWTEVYVNGKWYSADPISTRNTFGTINNWNTATATIYNRYTTLPF